MSSRLSVIIIPLGIILMTLVCFGTVLFLERGSSLAPAQTPVEELVTEDPKVMPPEQTTVSVTITPDTSAPTSTVSTPEPTASSMSTSTPTTTVALSYCVDAGECNADAQIYCADEWAGVDIKASWKLDLVRCLYDEHKNDISVACRESLECRQTLNDNLVTSCQSDKQKFCQNVQPTPGSEPLVDCLEDHFNELSVDCAAAWTAHDAAKPS